MTQAKSLSGNHIGYRVAFGWEFPNSLVPALICGELREIHHTARNEVFLNLTGDESHGDKTEFIVATDTEIWVQEQES